MQPGAEHEDCFEVLQAEAQEVVVPFNQHWELDGDVNAWARLYTGFMRAFTEAILAAALPEDLPQAAILEWIYERIEQCLMTTPERYAFQYISIGALLKRLRVRAGSSRTIRLHHLKITLTGGFVGVDQNFTMLGSPAGKCRILEAKSAACLMGTGAKLTDAFWLKSRAGG